MTFAPPAIVRPDQSILGAASFPEGLNQLGLKNERGEKFSENKGSDKRQRDAIATYAKHAGFVVVETYYDAAVSGADPIETRPGFLALLDRIGVRTVLIEDASRFARELITQELGILSLIKRGVRFLTAAGDDLTATDDPFKKAMRQIAGAFAELEKARLVAKLRHARDRISRSTTAGPEPHTTPVVAALQRETKTMPIVFTSLIQSEVDSSPACRGRAPT